MSALEIENAFMVSCIKRLFIAGFTTQEIFDNLEKESKQMISELTQEELYTADRIRNHRKGDK